MSSMYGVGGHPTERGVVSWGERHTTVDYPPATLYGLAIVGTFYGAVDRSYTDGPWLTVTIKSAILAGDVLLAVALWWLLRRRYGEDVARLAVAFYWLNPATLMDGPVLGYLDPWMGALTIAAVLAADAGATVWCGAAVALAVMTKAQAVFVVPVVALLLVHRSHARGRAIVLASASAIVTSAVLLAPFALRGALPNVLQGVGSLLRHDMLSGTAANLWWIVTWLMRAAYGVRDLGAWAAWTMTVRILGISRVIALGYPNPRPVATLLVAAAMAWAFWRARRGSLPVVLGAGAFAVHAYFVLSVQVHENHLCLALSLLAAAAAALPRLRAPLAAVSAIFALNLFLFYGVGRGFPLPPRGFTIIDATVVLAFVNVAALVWHGARFAECAGRSEETPHPAAIHRNRRAGHV